MIYDKFYKKKDLRIPIWFFLLCLISVIIFLNFFLNSSYLTISSRATTYPLRQIKVTNITHNQATIFWETSEKEKSHLLLGEKKNQLNKIYFDDREVPSERKPRNFHIVLLRGLEPEKEYYFKIITEKGVFGDLEGLPFFFKTRGNKEKIFLSPPIYGRVVDSKNQGVINAVVFLYHINDLLAITYTKEKGDWLVILKRANQSFNHNEKLKIEVYSEDKKKSVIEGKIDYLSPVKETIIIGKNYRFLTEGEVLSSRANRLIFKNGFEIFYPKDKAIISGFKPLIKGSGIPETDINITIKGKAIYSFKTKVDEKGNWSIDLPVNLEPGQYQLEVIGQELSTKLAKIREFTIAKSGEQVLGEATPSATLISPTISPTREATTATPTKFFTQTPVPTIYRSGNNFSYAYLFLSLIFFLLGGYLIIAR